MSQNDIHSMNIIRLHEEDDETRNACHMTVIICHHIIYFCLFLRAFQDFVSEISFLLGGCSTRQIIARVLLLAQIHKIITLVTYIKCLESTMIINS